VAVLNTLALMIALLAIGGGGWLGLLLARRVRISASPALRIGARSAGLWTWWLRLFPFLVVMIGVSFPVVLLLDAVVGDR
jgi:hypothetical protein